MKNLRSEIKKKIHRNRIENGTFQLFLKIRWAHPHLQLFMCALFFHLAMEIFLTSEVFTAKQIIMPSKHIKLHIITQVHEHNEHNLFWHINYGEKLDHQRVVVTQF